MPLVFMICMGMYGSGVRIRMEIIQRAQQQIRRAQQREGTVWRVAGLSTTVFRMLVLPTGASTRRPLGATTVVFVWRDRQILKLLLRHLQHLNQILRGYYQRGIYQQHLLLKPKRQKYKKRQRKVCRKRWKRKPIQAKG